MEAIKTRGRQRFYQEIISRTISILKEVDLEEMEITKQSMDKIIDTLRIISDTFSPKLGIEYRMSYGIKYVICPTCNGKHIRSRYKFCPWCGQSLGKKVELRDEDFY